MNFYYKDTLQSFMQKSTEEIIGAITLVNQFDSTQLQNKSWKQQIYILQNILANYEGSIFFEFSIPRLGRRVDTLLIINDIVFVIEFKVGESKFLHHDIEQVWDYALDLKNFHKPSHTVVLAPILVATEAQKSYLEIGLTSHNDNLLLPIKANKEGLGIAIESVLSFFKSSSTISGDAYAWGSYAPTPTIIEAAISLYNKHTVEEITRSDAGAINLTQTTAAISEIIEGAKINRKKIICFVTGVPGAGKTLVGLKVATQHLDKEKGNTSVYLSGNAPLVAILQEALTRDKVKREQLVGNKITKREAKQAVKSFIHIIHHYRDTYLNNPEAPYDHVAIFDEAQRAWNKEQTVKFMRQKKNKPDFDASEPEFLISCLNRHKDWAVIVCLVGGGQEINTGEAGISEWLKAIENTFSDWEVYISPHLTDSEYAAIEAIQQLQSKCSVKFNHNLHLGVSMRSFRAEHLSLFVKNILDLNPIEAKKNLCQIQHKYSIVLTRDLLKAKDWLKEKARGSERYGMVVSSQAQRLKPLAIDVKSPINPVNWFLEGKDDVRSSYYLEDVATEFQIQGLELDWSCITWDGDLRFGHYGWKTFAFKGNKWQNINNVERKKYLINAYRVLLTRARQGMIIVVPEGNPDDHTRKPEYYDATFNYLKSIGMTVI
ncbi:DUF2075 domain-containing protein [Sphingobacteriales bacterium UPWRP_1]|nr:hypothetical protein B6N25_00510 [Sphingobacteriales bacterium TSM_CSS]PSJ71930.1 DUF2075 domain-containing protein [Sphingobacteriales bacterium UPWRP_1]